MIEKTEIRVPDIGDFDQVPVIEVLVSEGDEIEVEQSLVTLESDKATMDVPATVAGRLVELRVAEGDEVSEGDVLAVVEVAGERDDSGEEASADDCQDQSDAAGKASESRAGAPDGSGQDEHQAPEQEKAGATGHSAKSAARAGRQADDPAAAGAGDLPAPPVPFEAMGEDLSKLPHAAPAVRKLARELGVALTGIEGSGRKGRITESDLKDHVKNTLKSPMAAGAGAGLDVAPPPQVDFSKYGEIEEETLSRIKQISGPKLHRNWVLIPHVTQFDEADITEMEAFRKANQRQAEQAGAKMTPLAFLIKAVVAALTEFPQFNASLANDGQTLVRKKYFHIGVAVDTPNGLVVPVLRDCNQKGLLELAVELAELSGRAREGKLKSDEMKGGCFSISSLGGIGGTAFTPIINAPELAILGVSRAAMKPHWNGEKFKPRLLLPLSLSYDHRVIDGADAARFTRFLAGCLEDLRRLLL